MSVTVVAKSYVDGEHPNLAAYASEDGKVIAFVAWETIKLLGMPTHVNITLEPAA